MSATAENLNSGLQFQHVAVGETLLQVKNLKMHFPVTEGLLFQRTIAHVKAVDGVSFEIKRGETLGLVGESGCGKTTTGRCILQLEKATAGNIIYRGVDLNTLHEKQLMPVRTHIQVIFQDPYSSLNPRMKIGDIIGEPMMVHRIQTQRSDLPQAGFRAVECLWPACQIC